MTISSGQTAPGRARRSRPSRRPAGRTPSIRIGRPQAGPGVGGGPGSVGGTPPSWFGPSGLGRLVRASWFGPSSPGPASPERSRPGGRSPPAGGRSSSSPAASRRSTAAPALSRAGGRHPGRRPPRSSVRRWTASVSATTSAIAGHGGGRRERGHGDLVGGIQPAGGARPRARPRMRAGGKETLPDRRLNSRREALEVDRPVRLDEPVRVAHRVADRQTHVGDRELGDRGTIAELHHGVHDRLRMDHDVDRS